MEILLSHFAMGFLAFLAVWNLSRWNKIKSSSRNHLDCHQGWFGACRLHEGWNRRWRLAQSHLRGSQSITECRRCTLHSEVNFTRKVIKYLDEILQIRAKFQILMMPLTRFWCHQFEAFYVSKITWLCNRFKNLSYFHKTDNIKNYIKLPIALTFFSTRGIQRKLKQFPSDMSIRHFNLLNI